MPMRPNLLLTVLLMGFTWHADPGQFFFSEQNRLLSSSKKLLAFNLSLYRIIIP